MPGVCVIGGGTAGAEAAREAARDGARVTVFEKDLRPAPPWSSWPRLIGGPERPEVGPGRPCLPPTVDLIKAEVRDVQGGSVLDSSGTRRQFDSVVLATGSGFAPVQLPGHRKPGAHVLSSAEAYCELGRRRSAMARSVVAGEGARALQVSERLCGEGRSIHIVVPRWRHAPSPDTLGVLNDAALERGATIARGSVARAVGERSVEAVVVDGGVLPCDTLVVLPDRVPRRAPTDARLGVSGGVSVDMSLRASSPYTLAAGGCAELQNHTGPPRILDEEPGMSGRIAGANAVGGSLRTGATVTWKVEAFGLLWSGAEPEPPLDGRREPRDCTVSRRWGQDAACTITFERRRGRVTRLEAVEPARAAAFEASCLRRSAPTLASLAYDGSSDISLVSDTARLGLQLWSKS